MNTNNDYFKSFGEYIKVLREELQKNDVTGKLMYSINHNSMSFAMLDAKSVTISYLRDNNLGDSILNLLDDGVVYVLWTTTEYDDFLSLVRHNTDPAMTYIQRSSAYEVFNNEQLIILRG